MSEALKNFTLLLWAMCAIHTNAYAGEKQGVAEENDLQTLAEAPTVVYGSAQTASGGEDTFVVEQPDNAPNPLGDPLPEPQTPPKDYTLEQIGHHNRLPQKILWWLRHLEMDHKVCRWWGLILPKSLETNFKTH